MLQDLKDTLATLSIAAITLFTLFLIMFLGQHYPILAVIFSVVLIVSGTFWMVHEGNKP